MPSSEKVVNYSSVTLWFAPISVFIAQQSTNLHQKSMKYNIAQKVWFWHFIWKLPKVCKIQAISGIEMLQEWTFCYKKRSENGEFKFTV